MLSGFLSFAVTEWLGMAWSFVIAGALAAAGVYLYGFASAERAIPLIGPLRNVGLGLICLAVVFACAAYFKHVGAQACESAWREKNLETQIANLNRDVRAWQAAAESNKAQADLAAQEKKDADNELAEYRDKINSLAPDLKRCRLASADDRRRLCQLAGNRAPGCQPAAVRTTRGRLPPDR